MTDNGADARTEDPEAMLEGLVERVEEVRDSYRARAAWHKRFFWGSGVIVILLSATLPLLAAFDYARKDVIVAIFGVAIAALTALRNFFHWDQSWSLLRQTDFELTHLLDEWRLEAAEAGSGPASHRVDRLAKATKRLLDESETVRRAESKAFFGRLSFPKGE